MAFITKKPNSKYWYAAWKDENGKRHNRSTKLEATIGIGGFDKPLLLVVATRKRFCCLIKQFRLISS